MGVRLLILLLCECKGLSLESNKRVQRPQVILLDLATSSPLFQTKIHGRRRVAVFDFRYQRYGLM
ncbi:hypothetical protein AVEN_130194-1, partial [Araneus ventricosus]